MTKSRNKFIKILNRDLNISAINSIFFNKENKEIIFTLNFTSGDINEDSLYNNLSPETFRWYLETEENYKNTGATLLNELMESGMFVIPCSQESNRLDVINIDNVSFIRYNKPKLTITFNFKNNICKNNNYISDFIHWKFSSLDSYLYELENISAFTTAK